jgi:hypothetical protein
MFYFVRYAVDLQWAKREGFVYFSSCRISARNMEMSSMKRVILYLPNSGEKMGDELLFLYSLLLGLSKAIFNNIRLNNPLLQLSLLHPCHSHDFDALMRYFQELPCTVHIGPKLPPPNKGLLHFAPEANNLEFYIIKHRK